MKESRKRNQSMECCKMLMAVIIVFNHSRFPAELDWIFNCLTCFVVPMFLAISGYFNYGATTGQLKRRLIHIAKLNILADAVHLIWSCIFTELQGGSTIAYLRAAIPDANELMWWLILNQNSFLGHLWYLAAIGVCYGVLWAYTSFFRNRKITYQPLYCMGFSLFAIYFVVAIVMPAAGMQVNGFVIRNGWLLGIPMFTLGMFLHEYQDQIMEGFQLNTRRLVLLSAFCIGLSLFQDRAIGLDGSPLGLPLGVASLMLLLIQNPQPFREDGWFVRGLVSRFALWSTYLYLFHLTVGMVYSVLLGGAVVERFGALEPWISPVIVLVLSLGFSIVMERGGAWIRNRKKSIIKM